jgi:hypothetical protein
MARSSIACICFLFMAADSFRQLFPHLLFAMAKVVSVCLVCLGALAGKFRAVATGVSWPAGRSDMLSPRSDGANAL